MNYLENPGNRLLRQNMNLERLDSSKAYFPHMNPDLPNPIGQAFVRANFMIPTVLGAEKARKFADSYRNFRVGAAALVMYQMGHFKAQQFIHGANMKPVEGLEEINVHAEHTLLSRVAHNYRPPSSDQTLSETANIAVLAVVGDLQADQQSGQTTRTLHPCGVCREQFDDPSSPVNEHTLFVTARPDMKIIEWFDLEALRQLHDNGDTSGMGFAEFDQRPLMLTVPDWYIEGQERGLTIPPFNESPEELAAEREFDRKVRDPIIDYILARQGIEFKRFGEDQI